MNKIALILAGFVLTGALAGCGSPDASQTSTAPETSTVPETSAESQPQSETPADSPEDSSASDAEENIQAQTAVSTDDASLQAVLDKGQLVIGLSADYPPYEFHQLVDGKDQVLGFDIQLAESLAAGMGVEAKIIDMNYDGLLAALQNGQVDMVISAMTPTEERKNSVDFSDIYYTASQTMVVRKDDAETLIDVASFDEKKIGVQKGSLQEGIASEQFPNAKTVSLAKVPNLVMELANKKTDGVIMETAVANGYLAQYPDLVASPVEIIDETGGTAVAMRKDSTALVEKSNEIIATLSQEGKLEEFMRIAVEQSSAE